MHKILIYCYILFIYMNLMSSHSPYEKLLIRAILIISGLILFVPLLVFSHTYFPFIVAKTAVMRVLIEVVLGLYLLLWLKNKDKWQPQFSWLAVTIAIYTSIMFLSSVFGDSPTRSWWSNWERMAGLFTFMHYGLWFMVLTSVLKQAKYWVYLAWTSLLVSLLMSIYAWLQYFDFQTSFIFMAGADRLSGTLGNPAYFGSYMTMNAFVSAMLMFAYKNWKKWLLLAYTVYLMVMVLFSGTRGAFLGLIAAGFVLLVLILSLKLWRQKIYRWIGIVGIVAIVLGGLVIVFRHSPILENNYFVKRFANISVNDNTAQTRLRSWNYGLHGFSDKWLLGYGPENFHVPFNRYFTADFYDYTGSEIWFDYAHSMIVETAATMGIGGLLAYLGLFISAGYIALQRVKNHDNPTKLHQSIIMILAMVAILVQNSFVFDSFNTYIVLFFILAWAGSWQVEFKPTEKVSHKLLPITLSIFLFIFIFYGFIKNVQAFSASSVVFDGYSKLSAGEYDQAMEFFDKSRGLTNNLADPMILYSQALVQKLSVVKTQEEASKLNNQFIKAEPLMIKAMDQDPDSVSLRLNLARFYMAWTQLTKNSDYIHRAEAEAQKAVDFSPQRLHAIWVLAQAQLMQAKYAEADANLVKAINYNPKQGQSYWLRFFVANGLNDKEKAVEYAWRAIENGFAVPSLPLIEDAIIYALKNGVQITSPQLKSAVEQALNMGTTKQYILDLKKQMPN